MQVCRFADPEVLIMSELNPKLPAHVGLLGYGGLVPFVGLVLLAGADLDRTAVWDRALVGYGAVILSFVGALHWGFAMSAAGIEPAQRRRAFVWSVVPALLAWPATLMATSAAALLLVLGFALHYVEDRRLAGFAALPAWYLPLRWRLTIVASVCLLASVWFQVGHG
jgi:hypothetical protein